MTEVIATFEPVANKSSITLPARITGQLPSVNGDRAKLYSVLTNLLENAMKLTEPGGKVDLEASPQQEGRVCWLAVTGAAALLLRKRKGHMSSNHSPERERRVAAGRDRLWASHHQKASWASLRAYLGQVDSREGSRFYGALPR